MANLFKKNQQISQYQLLENKYSAARGNLIFMLIFTVINMVMLFVDVSSYFLFSAIIPYSFVSDGMLLTGRFPEEAYEYYRDQGLELIIKDDSFFVLMMVIAVAVVAVYLICWILSKKQVGWMIAALVLFSVDTLALFWFYGFTSSIILDLLFHAWVLYYLAGGVYAHFKLKKLPPEPEETDIDSIPTDAIQ